MPSPPYCLLHPKLTDCRRLFLRNYASEISIGVHESEKHGKQRVTINVDLFVPLTASTPVNDALCEVVDYDFIRDTVAHCLTDSHVYLQETICDDLVRLLLAHPQARAVRVAIEKPHAYPDSEGVGVEVFKFREG
jgi:dihydroneopterin aldolase